MMYSTFCRNIHYQLNWTAFWINECVVKLKERKTLGLKIYFSFLWEMTFTNHASGVRTNQNNTTFERCTLFYCVFKIPGIINQFFFCRIRHVREGVWRARKVKKKKRKSRIACLVLSRLSLSDWQNASGMPVHYTESHKAITCRIHRARTKKEARSMLYTQLGDAWQKSRRCVVCLRLKVYYSSHTRIPTHICMHFCSRNYITILCGYSRYRQGRGWYR